MHFFPDLRHINAIQKMLQSIRSRWSVCRVLHWLLLLGTWDIASSFIGAKCKVQLKTGVSYMVDIEVDNNGVVLAALCKCAAGMGPEARCRRVVIVLPGLTVYRDEGGMKREQTYPTAAAVSCCEEDAWGWGHLWEQTTCSYQETKLCTYLPHLPERRYYLNYNNFFLNTWKACPRVGQRPVAQLSSPANVRGIINDHVYLRKPPDTHCL